MSETGDRDGIDRMYFARFVGEAVRRARRDTTRTYPSDSSSRATSLSDNTWLALNAIDPLTGEPAMTRQAADGLLNEPRSGFVAPATIRSIAALFSWSDADVYGANAIAVGLQPPPTEGSEWARTIWPQVDQLPEGAKAAKRDDIYWTLRIAGLIE